VTWRYVSSGMLGTSSIPEPAPTNVVDRALAPRLDTLEGKTIQLIDIGFGVDGEFLEEAAAWFAATCRASRPFSSTERHHVRGRAQMWEDAKANAHAVNSGWRLRRLCGPVVAAHCENWNPSRYPHRGHLAVARFGRIPGHGCPEPRHEPTLQLCSYPLVGRLAKLCAICGRRRPRHRQPLMPQIVAA